MFKKIISLTLGIIMVLSVFSAAVVSADKPQTDFNCNNVILLIGSGMSQDHIDAALLKNRGELNLSKFEYSGTITTENSLGKVTDAAAAANALATGYKTVNFVVGNLDNGENAYTITEAAKDAGKKVGIITDKALCDSTPAAFSANAAIKSDYSAITLAQLDSDIDLLFGGGSVYFDRHAKEVSKSGYKYIKSHLQLNYLTPNTGKVLGAFANYSFKNVNNKPSLAQMFEVATKVLENDNGFFIVLEGGLIEEGSYANNMNNMVNSLIEFDNAVGKAMEYVDANPDTLLVVTGDYEAGSLTLPANPSSMNVVNSCFKSKAITTEKVPFFTYGKNASAFTGERDNTDIPKLIAISMGVNDFINDITPIPSDRDYFSDELSSFSGWNFLNVKKNSKVNGVTLTTTSANNSAVTATCNSSLVIMSNARVGFELTVKSPLPSPFVLKSNSSNDLSEYGGFVITTSPLEGNTLTLTVGRGDEFSASIDINSSMINEYGEYLLEFSEFTPAITPENAVGLDTFKISGNGGSAKTTYILYDIKVANVDKGLNYAEVLANSAAYDSHYYTPETYNEFIAARDLLKAAVTINEKYDAKLALIEKMNALQPVDIVSESFDIISANSEDIDLYGTSYTLAEKGINAFCGFTPSTLTFTNIPQINGGYDFISVTMSSLTPDLSYSDEFNVTLTVNTSNGSFSDTILRPVVSEGKYCFDISNITSDITSVELSFNNRDIGAILNISDFELVSTKKPIMMSAGPSKLSALQILRAVAGLVTIDGGDVNGDGTVDVSDALQLLRIESKL